METISTIVVSIAPAGGTRWVRHRRPGGARAVEHRSRHLSAWMRRTSGLRRSGRVRTSHRGTGGMGETGQERSPWMARGQSCAGPHHRLHGPVGESRLIGRAAAAAGGAGRLRQASRKVGVGEPPLVPGVQHLSREGVGDGIAAKRQGPSNSCVEGPCRMSIVFATAAEADTPAPRPFVRPRPALRPWPIGPSSTGAIGSPRRCAPTRRSP